MATAGVAALACVAGAHFVYEQPKPGFIPGWVEGNSPTGEGTDYKTLEEAMVACDQFTTEPAGGCKLSAVNAKTPGSGCVCHGITLQRGNYQLRGAPAIQPTPSDEQSWLRTETICSGSSWGLHFLVLVLCGGALYGGGGRLYNQRYGRSEWPHAAQWAQLRGLVMDGAVFARSRAQGAHRSKRRGGYERVEETPRGLKSSSSSSSSERRKEGELEPAEVATRERSPRMKGTKEKKQRQASASAAASAAGERGAGEPPSSTQSNHEGTASKDLGPRASASAGGGRWVHVPT
jgi:hypothetical protein